MPWDERLRRRVKLRDLDLLMAVIQTQSMGKAASIHNISQPAVSKAIAELEQTLGVRLLERFRKGVEPTLQGAALARRCAAIFEELRQGVQDLDFISDPAVGNLRIGATEPASSTIVSSVIHRLSATYPRMSFDVVTGDATTLYRELEARNIEMAMLRLTEPVKRQHAVENLFYDDLVVVAGASNSLCRRRGIKLADLMHERWIMGPADSIFGSLQAEAFQACGLSPPQPTVTTVSSKLREELLSTGHFFSILPSFFLRFPRKHPSLRELPVKLANARHPISIVTLKGQTPSAISELFVKGARKLTKTLA